jgi:hypothetical protein
MRRAGIVRIGTLSQVVSILATFRLRFLMAGAVTSGGVEPGVLPATEGETFALAKGDDPASPGATAATEQPAMALRKSLRLDRVTVIKFLQNPSK